MTRGTKHIEINGYIFLIVYRHFQTRNDGFPPSTHPTLAGGMSVWGGGYPRSKK